MEPEVHHFPLGWLVSEPHKPQGPFFISQVLGDVHHCLALCGYGGSTPGFSLKVVWWTLY